MNLRAKGESELAMAKSKYEVLLSLRFQSKPEELTTEEEEEPKK
jgi:hypothetical protein